MKTIAKHLLPLLVGLLFAVPAFAQVVRQIGQPAIGMEQFDMWIFQSLPNRGKLARHALESRADLEILRISQSINLNDSQTEHLRLAGYGDIKRFFDRVERVRRQFLAMQNRIDRNNLNEAYQLAVPLQQELTAGLFGPKSLLQKTITSTLDEEQLAVWKQEQARDARLRAERAVKLFIAQMQRQVPMTANQRDSLSEMLLEKVKFVPTNDPYTNYLLQYHLSEIPRDAYLKIFDDSQMKAIDQSINQGRAVINALKKQGLIDG